MVQGGTESTPRPLASGALPEGVTSIEDDLATFEHLYNFLALGKTDFELLRTHEKMLHNIMDRISPEIYKHLLSFETTRIGLVSLRHQGEVDLVKIAAARMGKFAGFLKRLVSWPEDDLPGLHKMMHDNSMLHHKYVNIPLSHLTLALAMIQGLLTTHLAQEESVSKEESVAVLVAVSKLLWLQSVTFTSTYMKYHSVAHIPTRQAKAPMKPSDMSKLLTAERVSETSPDQPSTPLSDQ